MADTRLVKFVTGVLADYTALDTKDENTLYFITDERRIYKGDVPMSGGIYKAVTAYPATGENNVIYVNTTDGSVQYWNGASYQVMVKPTVTAISGTGDNLHLASTKAIVDYVASQLSDVNSAATALTTRVSTLETKMSAAEGRLDTIQGTGAGSISKALEDAKAYTDDLANGAVKTNADAIADLESGKADKATTLAGYGITNAYTKTEADSAIASAVANASHLKREIVDALPAVASAKENTIYMVKKSGGSGDQNYDEYMLINGAFEKIGDTKVDLSNYATKTDVATAKSEAISAAATDATTKADAAQAAAESTAATALNAYKTSNNAAVKANKDAIDVINGEGAGSIKKAAADTLDAAKSYADGLGDGYATAAQGALADTALQKADIVSGSANGTISVDGTDVAVKGLGSAAYTATTAYDAAGKAATALSDAKAYTDTALTWGQL